MASNPSTKPPARKRARLSHESSSESSSSSAEANTSPLWDLQAVAAAQRASEAYPTLDTAGNPMLTICTTRQDVAIVLHSPPLRNLDWRHGNKKHLYNPHSRRAALGQRSGTAALPGQECGQCMQKRGPFNACVVLHPQSYEKALGHGACMNCLFGNRASGCSFRTPLAPEWILEWNRANNPNRLLFGNAAQVVGHIPVSAHTDVPFSVHDGSAASPSARPKQHGPVYSAKWYKTPLDDRSLAKDISGMIAVRKDLRGILARVTYDIKKLSEFAGDDELEETLEDNEPNPFYYSDSGRGDDDTGSAPARSEKDDLEVESGNFGSTDADSVDVSSLSVGSVDLDSDDVGSDVDRDVDE